MRPMPRLTAKPSCLPGPLSSRGSEDVDVMTAAYRRTVYHVSVSVPVPVRRNAMGLALEAYAAVVRRKVARSVDASSKQAQSIAMGRFVFRNLTLGDNSIRFREVSSHLSLFRALLNSMQDRVVAGFVTQGLVAGVGQLVVHEVKTFGRRALGHNRHCQAVIPETKAHNLCQQRSAPPASGASTISPRR